MAKRVLKDYPNVSISLADLLGPIDFEDIMGRKSPVHIEIGCGKGTLLLAEAVHSPHIDFLGIEWANKYYRFAVDRIGRWGLRNVRIIRADAAEFLAEYLADESVSCFHIYFPDPWPKKCHHKRRFLNQANTDQMLRCLKKDGIIQIATDHADYFTQIEQVIAGQLQAGRIEITDFVCASGAADGELVGTNYERKYAKAGRHTYTKAIIKK